MVTDMGQERIRLDSSHGCCMIDSLELASDYTGESNG